jgi:hypothetical protein
MQNKLIAFEYIFLSLITQCAGNVEEQEREKASESKRVGQVSDSCPFFRRLLFRQVFLSLLFFFRRAMIVKEISEREYSEYSNKMQNTNFFLK